MSQWGGVIGVPSFDIIINAVACFVCYALVDSRISFIILLIAVVLGGWLGWVGLKGYSTTNFRGGDLTIPVIRVIIAIVSDKCSLPLAGSWRGLNYKKRTRKDKTEYSTFAMLKTIITPLIKGGLCSCINGTEAWQPWRCPWRCPSSASGERSERLNQSSSSTEALDIWVIRLHVFSCISLYWFYDRLDLW